MKPRDFFAVFPEPDELTAQCEQAAQNRAWREKKCAKCGQPRSVHGFKASSNEPGCAFVEGES